MAEEDTGSTAGKFTQADVNRIVAERLSRLKEQYADYDELKAAAAVASKSQSQLDKVSQQLDALTKRAEAAEAENVRNEVIREKGLSARQAKRLRGASRDELLADADDLLENFPEKDAGKSNGTGKISDTGTTGGEGTEEDDDEQDDEQDAPQQQTAPARTGRPRERLRSGAPATQTRPEETDPMKLAALIPRR